MQSGWYDGFTPTFKDFFRLRDELDQLFDIGLPMSNIRSVPRGTFPAINMKEGKDALTIQAYLPGIDPKEIDVSIEKNALIIQGKREAADVGDKASCHRRERFSGSFSRIISLPEGLDTDKVAAQYLEGVLNIRIDKVEEKKPKQISVKVD